MLWLTVLLAGLISIAALLYVLAPLLRPGPAPRLVDDDRLTDLLGRKDAVVRSIKELEFDYHVGKLNDEDYERLNARLRRQAIGLLQQIEKLAPATASLDEQLEAQIASLRRTQDGHPDDQGRSPAAPADRVPIETDRQTEINRNGDVQTAHADPEPTSDRAADNVRFCTNCGQPLDLQHKFCAHCGEAVAAATQSSP